MPVPLVAVWMITYNHERYIGQAIESVMMQQTDFPYMLYLGEDFSTDNTRNICIEYANRYPEKITLFLNSENNHRKNGERIYQECFNSGARYMAMLEGDDYWIDDNKLRKQVDFMQSNEQYSMCFHDCEIRRDDGTLIMYFRERFVRRYQKTVFTYPDVVQYKVLAATSSYFYKNPQGLPEWFYSVYGGDGALLLILSKTGKLGYIREVMSVYRMHNTGFESKYYTDPMAKSLRNLTEDYIYLGLIEPFYRPIVLKRIIWNRFYRIAKGLTLGKFRHIPVDTMRMMIDSIKFLGLNAARALRITRPVVNP